MTVDGAGEDPLWERDPQAWRAQLAEGNRHQPRKRVAAKVLLSDTEGRLLLVDPVYKPWWDLPGGMAEANEAPHEAAARELREELGLDVRLRRLLCVDWVGPHGPWDDLLMFVFDGGQLAPDTAEGLSPVDEELHELGWFTHVRAAELLRGDIWSLTRHALRARDEQATVYLDQGQSPFPQA